MVRLALQRKAGKGWGQTHGSDPRSSLALQIGQNGEHAAVILGRRRQTEFREDARHVLLDRAEGDHEPLRDRLVRTPLGHQLQYLAFAWSQLVQRVVAAAPADEL